MTFAGGLFFGGLRYRQTDASGPGRQRFLIICRGRHVRNQRAARQLRKYEFVGLTVDRHVYQITESNLSGSHQIRQRLNQESFDRAFQMARTVLVVDTFLQEHVLRFV